MDSKNRSPKFWAGGFLYNQKKNEVFLHLRDGNTRFNPNKYAFFGGLQEGSESPSECFVREVDEEIGVAFTQDQIVLLCDYLNEELRTYRYVFYIKSDLPKSAFTLGEGRGFEWISLG